MLAEPEDKNPSTAIIIGIMVLISGTLQFTQERKGANAAAALRKLVTITCCVVHASRPDRKIPMAEISFLATLFVLLPAILSPAMYALLRQKTCSSTRLR